ncbi:MAG: type VI secretion system ATPase TssH [Planctomycetes bacterium]|nr:type VI secretion system ATPase TssH [Planctomycetota bacterium]
MIQVDLKSLLRKLAPVPTACLESAAGRCVRSGCYEVEPEHLMLELLAVPEGDWTQVLRTFAVEPGPFERALQSGLGSLARGNNGRPVWSRRLIELIRDGWLVASVECRRTDIRSVDLLLAAVRQPARYRDAVQDLLATLPSEALLARLPELLQRSSESIAAEQAEPDAALGSDTPLGRFTTDYTGLAERGVLDPVFGRDTEIRKVVQILCRRRKNNPILVGEAGVGKTALVEGLALRIAHGDAPDSLRTVRLLGLDLGALQAGASVRGEFENRVKQVLQAVRDHPLPVVLFLDEAHTLIGAGGPAGGGDAANLLKPALARGELRTIAATTWAEYVRYFDRDAALSRRFQAVKLDEPNDAATVQILRGLRGRYEASHGVRIHDAAIVACARLGTRYISGRQHPDKGVDLLDTAAARVRLGYSGAPAEVQDAQRQIAELERECDALRRDFTCGVEQDAERVAALEDRLAAARGRLEVLTERWSVECDAVERVRSARERDDDPGAARQALGDLRAVQGDSGMVELDVTADTVAQVVADWTGVPAGRLMADEARTVLELEDRLRQRIKGQDHALEVVARAIRDAKSGAHDPQMPTGAFLCVGPSGVGKTECALALADLLFGGERFLTTVHMSEFQEKHTVSRLIGAPPGYVGYGEGGVLTEAVRQRPYSVVLLDEVEKADPEVMNLFYQVFDKGVLCDGEGREIDFTHSLVYMTSNLASDAIASLCAPALRGEGDLPSPSELEQAIRPILARWFKPALLARMTVVPFYPLDGMVMRDVARLQLGRLGERLRATHGTELLYADEVVAALAASGIDGAIGARNVHHALRGMVQPEISRVLLQAMEERTRQAGAAARGQLGGVLQIGLDGGGFHARFLAGQGSGRNGQQ